MFVQSTPTSKLILTSPQMLLAVFACTVTSVILGAQPMLIDLYSDHLHLDLRQSGWLLTTEQFGGAIGAILGYWLAPRTRWTFAIGAACAVAVGINLVSGYVNGFGEILVVRFACGLFMMIAYTVEIYVLGHAATPDRAFGLLLVLQGLCSSTYIMLVPWLTRQFGYVAAIGSDAWWLIAALIAACWLPGNAGSTDSPQARHDAPAGARPVMGAAALFGGFLLQLSAYAVWGFLAQVGRQDGFSDTSIGYAIGLGSIAGTPAGLLPMILGARFGRIPLIGGATVALIASFVALAGHLGLTGFMVCVALINVGWVVGLPYFMALTVVHDPDGRFTRLLPFAQIASAALGPASVTPFISGAQLWPIFLIASVAALTGLVAVIGSCFIGVRQPARSR
jgi:hypothetical protein